MSNLSVFSFESHEVRTILDDNNNPWFVAKDVCEVLEHTNHKVAYQSLDTDEVSKVYLIDEVGREQETTILSESGLYALVIRSNKPKAKVFRKWITSEVLPAIRKTGKYEMGAAPRPAFGKHERNLKDLTIELKSTNAVISLIARIEKTLDPVLKEVLYEQLELRLGKPVARHEKTAQEPSLFEKTGGAA